MRPAPTSVPHYGQKASLRRRAVSLLLALAINILILIMLLKLAPAIQGVPTGRNTAITFGLQPEPNASKSTRAATARQAIKRAAAAKTRPAAPVPPIVQVPTPALDKLLSITREDYAAADISKMPAQAEEGTSGAASGSRSGDSELAQGAGPDGEPLYRAEWYREPTDAELQFYLPKNGVPPGSWAVIACKTAARFHVEDCIFLADSPPGSHIGNAILQAAWQFLVRPPRVGGKSLVGSWVSIRITFDRIKRRE